MVLFAYASLDIVVFFSFFFGLTVFMVFVRKRLVTSTNLE